jgi:hypothetical protein
MVIKKDSRMLLLSQSFQKVSHSFIMEASKAMLEEMTLIIEKLFGLT